MEYAARPGRFRLDRRKQLRHSQEQHILGAPICNINALEFIRNLLLESVSSTLIQTQVICVKNIVCVERLLQHVALPDSHIPRLEIHPLLADFYAGPGGAFQFGLEMPDELPVSTAEVETLDCVRSYETPQRLCDGCEAFCGQRAIREGFCADCPQFIVRQDEELGIHHHGCYRLCAWEVSNFALLITLMSNDVTK